MNPAATAVAELAALVAEVTEALAATLLPDGELRDPVSGRRPPSDHYAESFTALALAVRDGHDPRWRELLASWSRRSSSVRGHAPFQRLALLALRDVLQRRGALHGADAERLAQALQLCETEAHYPANNWVLLARLCDLLEADGEQSRRTRAAAFGAHWARWTTRAGGFIDAPEQPATGALATPPAYHAKAALLFWLARLAAPAELPETPLAAALAWHFAFADAAGRPAPCGRSTSALFGSAAVAGLLLAGARGAAAPRNRQAYASGLSTLVAALRADVRRDGLLSLSPSPRSGSEGGWDEYMHVSVYNAWFAGLLAFLLDREQQPGDPDFPAPDASALGPQPAECAHDRQAGLVALRGKRLDAVLSTTGQRPQILASDAAELRGAGALPVQLRLDGRDLVAPPALLRAEDLASQPALAGWTPLVAAAGRIWGLLRLREVHHHSEGARLVVILSGSPVAVARTGGSPLHFRFWLEEFEEQLGSRRARLRHAARPERLSGLRFSVALVADADAGWFVRVLRLHGSAERATWLSPHGGGWLPAARAAEVRHYEAPAETDFAWREAPGTAAVSGLLPVVRADAVGRCGVPRDWPQRDLVVADVVGPHGTCAQGPPLRLGPVAGTLELPWARVPFP